MKVPRFLAVFLGGAGALLGLALLKASVTSSLGTLPSAKILVFASAFFGLVAAAIDWALLRDVLPMRRSFGKSQIEKDDRSAPPRIESAERLIQFMSHVADEKAPTFQPEAKLPEGVIIRQARMNPIVFSEICRPGVNGLSFYGGLPIAPAGFPWPVASNKPGKQPLSFVMQWDCAELAKQDATGMLPGDGVLYFFCDLAWGEPFDFHFVHAPGPSNNWQLLQPPDNLPPIYGEEGAHLVPYCSPRVEKRLQDVPRVLPRWPFATITFAYPRTEAPDSDGRFWNQSDAVAEALLALGHPQHLPPPESVTSQAPQFARPFQAFPHDWAAVRIVAAELLQSLHYPDASLLRERSEYDRKTTLRRWAEGAAELYTSAAALPPSAAVEQSASDRIWRRIELMAPALGPGWNSLVLECVNTSLGLQSEALKEIPQSLLAECARRHQLASHYFPGGAAGSQAQEGGRSSTPVRAIHAPTPNHMFGPPSFVQGHVEEYLDEWILLLELSTRKQIGHEFGEGVYQFMIRPVHLQEKRFDRVKLIASAY